MKILIMGGTKFVSRALAMHLIEKGHEVSIFTRNKTAVDYTGIANHYRGDRKVLADLKQLENVKFEVVFDISAYVLQDVTNLLSYLDQSNLQRYIFCSSGAVYLPSSEVLKETAECGYNENWGDYGLDKLSEYHLAAPCVDLKEGLRRAYQGFLKDKHKIEDAKMCKVEEAIES